MGINGAAIAMAAAQTMDAVLLFTVSYRFLPFSPKLLVANSFLKTSLVVCGLAIGTALLIFLAQSILLRMLGMSVLLALFMLLAWQYAIDSVDRKQLLAVFNAFTNRVWTYLFKGGNLQ